MDQHIEIEFKNLLSKEAFERLVHYFQIAPDSFITQQNHYFDTKDFDLKKQYSALRIREKNEAYELTLKQPAKEGLLESNQALSKQEAEAFLHNGLFPEGPIQALLIQAKLNPSDFICFGSLRTDRAELPFQDGLLVVDHSFYAGKEDYELEYEVQDAESGEKIFRELLETLQIPLQETENKVKRFYEATFGE
ncbi:CYTH domain-containing protein [Peribacillus asahii]|uniref:CYTH domain-containing protein n=1 Tax=Peribacillus asahii TaxID=228899 RepID=UPI0030462DF7